MDHNPNAFRLVWSDGDALERRAVTLACTGTTEELEAYLNLLRRRCCLEVVETSDASDVECFARQPTNV